MLSRCLELIASCTENGGGGEGGGGVVNAHSLIFNMNVCMCVCTCACVCVCVYVRVCACMCVGGVLSSSDLESIVSFTEISSRLQTPSYDTVLRHHLKTLS